MSVDLDKLRRQCRQNNVRMSVNDGEFGPRTVTLTGGVCPPLVARKVGSGLSMRQLRAKNQFTLNLEVDD